MIKIFNMKIVPILFLLLAIICCTTLAKSHRWNKHSSEKTPCILSTQYVCDMMKFEISSDNQIENYMLGQIYYNWDDKQIRFDSRLWHNESDQYTFWMDYNKDVGYAYNRVDHECYEFTPNKTLYEPQIPKDAIWEGTRVIGSQSIDSWMFKDDEEEDLFMLLGVTPETCIPTSFTIIDSSEHRPVYISELWNYLPELPPFYFDLPTECDNNSTSKRFQPKPIPKNIMKSINSLNF